MSSSAVSPNAVSRAVATTSAHIESMLVQHPDVLERLVDADAGAWAATDPDLLDLCRLRMAMLLGHPDEAASDHLDPEMVAALASWPSSPLFDDSHRACLAFTEQFVIDVASLDDDLAAGVLEHLGGDGLVSFTNALLVMEQRIRLTLVWRRLFPDHAVPATATTVEEAS